MSVLSLKSNAIFSSSIFKLSDRAFLFSALFISIDKIPLSISLGETIYLEIQTSQSSYTLEIIVLIPWIILLVYFIFPGTKGHNRFGANPIKKVINHQE